MPLNGPRCSPGGERMNNDIIVRFSLYVHTASQVSGSTDRSFPVLLDGSKAVSVDVHGVFRNAAPAIMNQDAP